MTLRKTEIIEWSTTPAELRRIADEMEYNLTEANIKYSYTETIKEPGVWLYISIDESQWQAEQAEGKE